MHSGHVSDSHVLPFRGHTSACVQTMPVLRKLQVTFGLCVVLSSACRLVLRPHIPSSRASACSDAVVLKQSVRHGQPVLWRWHCHARVMIA